ncbi:MAG: site-specific integrase [Sulfobacillus sp.]
MGELVGNKLFTLVRDFFKSYLPNVRKCSPNTIRSYQKALELLFDFVKSEKHVKLNEITFQMIDSRMLERFLDHVENERGCSGATRNHRLQCIRAFYTYVAETEATAVAYWQELKKVKSAISPKKSVEHMSETAVTAVLEQTDTSTQKGLRDMFIMLFLYQTGARVQELLDVRLCDIRWGSTPTVTLHGKGGKVRAVPLREKAVEHLKKYIAVFHPNQGKHSEQHLIYVIRDGVKKRMTEDNVRRLVCGYGIAARKVCPEVPENVHPHLFRHSRAMHLYQSGVDLTLVSQWLGHSKLDTTLIYAHADTELKRQAIANSIPEDSPLSKYLNTERYKVDDEDLLKQLCGLR